MPPENASQAELIKDVARGVGGTLVLFAVALFLPVLGFACVPFIPLPSLFFRIKLGRKKGALVPAISMAILLVLTGGNGADMLLLAGLLALGYGMGEAMGRNLPLELVVAAPTAAVMVLYGAGILLAAQVAGTSPLALVSGYVEENLRLTLKLYESMGMPGETIAAIQNAMAPLRNALVAMLPSLAASSTLFLAWATLLMARPMFARAGLPIPAYGPLNAWKAPDVLVWGVIAFGVMFFPKIHFLRFLGFNGIIVLAMVYFFQGIAVVSFYFDKKRTPVFIRVFFYVLLALQQFLLIVVIGIGLFDTWANFRRIGREEPPRET